MNKIEEMLQELCPNGVEWKTLGEVAEYIRGVTYKKTDEVSCNDGYKILRANNITLGSNVINFDDIKVIDYNSNVKENQKLFRNDILISVASGSREHVGKVGFVFENLDYYFGGFMGVIRCINSVNSRYVFHILTDKIFQSYLDKMLATSTINNINSKMIKEFYIPIPPLEIQAEIVQILDKFTDCVTELTAELTAELTKRQKQYSFYRDKLLSFEDAVYQVEWKTLGEVLEKGKGTKITANQMKILHKEGSPVRIFAGGQTYADVDFEDIPEKDIHTDTEIIVKSRGVIDFEYYNKPFSFKNEFWSYKAKDKSVKLRYVFHYLKYKRSYFQNIANNMQMPQISSKDTEKFKIPIPSLAIQSRIVQVLDNFDAVCNDLNIGLPKEIELRQKQYEYFRDKLLTFTAEGVYTNSTVQCRAH